jgi:hypothetical protein
VKGILFYSRLDYEPNKEFASWVIAEFEKNGVEVALVFLEDFYVERKLHFEPDFIINRTRDYNLSVLFEFNGIRSFNNSNMVLIGNNKYSCYKFVKDLDIPVKSIPIEPGFEVFIKKPIAGHGGESITLSTNAIFKRDYIYQEFIPNVIGDIRFYVIGNKIIISVLRCKPIGSILCNYKQGAEIQLYEASDEQLKIITKLIKRIGTVDFIGIDFFLTEDNQFIFNEIEDVVGSRMLSALGCNNTVPLYVEHILRCMNN